MSEMKSARENRGDSVVCECVQYLAPKECPAVLFLHSNYWTHFFITHTPLYLPPVVQYTTFAYHIREC